MAEKLIGFRITVEELGRLERLADAIRQQESVVLERKVKPSGVARKCFEIGLPLLEERVGLRRKSRRRPGR